MFRVFLCILVLAFSSAAPYGGFSLARTLPAWQEPQLLQKATPAVRVTQAEDTDVVDTLGAGYSFFKKQPISSRPVFQQKPVVNDRSSISSFTDTSDQWSGYTKSSAFKQPLVHTSFEPVQRVQPVLSQMRSSPPAAYGSQQRIEKNILRDKSNDGYGQQVQPVFNNLINEGDFRPEIPQISQPVFRTVADSGYGQQQQIGQDQPTLQVTKCNIVNQPSQPIVSNLIDEGQFNQQIQEQFPLTTRTTSNGYGQQEQLEKSVMKFQSNDAYGQQQLQPTFNDLIGGGGYGQQVQRKISMVPTIKSVDNGYGQQEQLEKSVLRVKSMDNFAQVQPTYSSLINEEDFRRPIPQVVRPVMKTVDAAYGQQQQEQPLVTITTCNVVSQPAQPAINTRINQGDYSQQIREVIPTDFQPVSTGCSQQQQKIQSEESQFSFQSNDAYGQQVQQPLIRQVDSGYGEQVQQPLIRQVESGYGQQVQQPLIRQVESGYGQQVSQRVKLPIVEKLVTDYSQQQADFAALPMIQPLIASHHTDFSRSNSALMSSTHMAPKSQSFGAGGYGRR